MEYNCVCGQLIDWTIIEEWNKYFGLQYPKNDIPLHFPDRILTDEKNESSG